jgi:hypothetical protein
LPREARIPPRQGVNGIADLLLSKAAHLRDQLSEFDEVGVENTGGVFGDVHVISAGVGDSIGARTA